LGIVGTGRELVKKPLSPTNCEQRKRTENRKIKGVQRTEIKEKCE